jgi:hypothetical protein
MRFWEPPLARFLKEGAAGRMECMRDAPDLNVAHLLARAFQQLVRITQTAPW